MKYLVKSNLGGYYITESEPEVIEKTCGDCDKTDDVVLSYEGSLSEALNDYFKTLAVSKDRIIYMCNEYINERIIEHIEEEYEIRLSMLNYFQETNNISEKEYNTLLKTIFKSKKSNIELFKNIKNNYYEEIIKAYKVKKYQK